MEPDDHPLRILVPNPMRLCPARQCDALGGNAVALAEREIDVGCWDTRVHLLFEVEVAQLGAHQAIYDVFEVFVGAILAFERGSPQSSRRRQHFTMNQQRSLAD